MDRVTACMICKSGVGKLSCSMCGSIACQQCFDIKKNLCMSCGKGKQAGVS